MSLIKTLVESYKTGKNKASINSVKQRFHETTLPEPILKKSTELEKITENYGVFQKKICDVGYSIEHRRQNKIQN